MKPLRGTFSQKTQAASFVVSGNRGCFSEALRPAQRGVQYATHAHRHFTCRRHTSHTAGTLIAPQGTLRSKKTTFVQWTNVVFFVARPKGFEPLACRLGGDRSILLSYGRRTAIHDGNYLIMPRIVRNVKQNLLLEGTAALRIHFG